MGYRALYREFRPQQFADIVGQLHITQTLQNAVTSGRVSHAYLFCGPRGTGKTTTAKVLAKALNCLNGPGQEPCNNCNNCVATNQGASVDVIEIDAASNRGIEDIRELREKVKYSPANGKYRIYIIDEVHMLTTEAFNALLKTLEEPPAHVVFVLATTEPHKLPLTILSRCQRFDFRRIGVNDMLPRLKQVAETAGLQVEEEALKLIAKAAEGGLRDALSIMDQGSVFGNDSITVEDVHNILGTVREDLLSEMSLYLAKGNTQGGIALVNNLLQQGKDLRLLVKELNGYLRALMLYLVSGSLPESGDRERIKSDAQEFKPIYITKCIEVFTKLEYDMKWSVQPIILLELALVKLTIQIKEDMPSLETPLEKPVHNKQSVEKITVEKITLEEAAPASNEDKLNSNACNNEASIDSNKEQDIQKYWIDILEKVKRLKPSVYGVFREAQLVKCSDSTITIGFQPQHAKFHKVMAEQNENKQIFEQAANETLGGKWSLKIVLLQEDTGQGQVNPLAKDNNKHPLVNKAIELFGEDIVEVKE